MGMSLASRCRYFRELRNDSGERGPRMLSGLPAACRQHFAEVLRYCVPSLGKLPRLTGWQPVLPRQSLRALFGAVGFAAQMGKGFAGEV